MKIRPLEKDVYNYVKRAKFVTPNRLSMMLGNGEYGIHSGFIPSAFVGINMSAELVEAIFNLRNNASIYEIACGENFYNLVGGCTITTDAPIAKFKKIHNSIPYQKYGYSGPRWLPVVYCNNDGVLWMLKTVFDEKKISNSSEETKAYNSIVNMVNGTVYEKHLIMCNVSELLTEDYKGLWENKVKIMKNTLFNESGLRLSDEEIKNKIKFVKKQMTKKHKYPKK